MLIGIILLATSLASGYTKSSTTTVTGPTTTVTGPTTTVTGPSTGSTTVYTITTTAKSTTSNIVVPVSCSVTPASGSTGASFTFSAFAQVTAPVYTWSFGDGSSGTGPTVTHAYASPGTWTATVSMQNDDGYTGKGVCSVTVTPISVGGMTSTLIITVVAGSGDGAVQSASVTLFTTPPITLVTNSGGQVVFNVPAGTYGYGVSATGFQAYSGTVTLTNAGNQVTVFLATVCVQSGRICPQSGLGGGFSTGNAEGGIAGFILFVAGFVVYRRKA